VTPARPPVADPALHLDVAAWLAWEAELLDAGRYREWLGLLADDVRYRMPVSVTRDRRGGAPQADAMDHFDEDRYSLEKRVERLEGGHAWTEDPPSRTRRFVTNIRVVADAASGDVGVRSYLLLYRSRGDLHPASVLSAERVDHLRRIDGGWLLARRDIALDDAVVRMQNLAVFL
jgi:3-phenylpropionate/cinnamic acid dioxygenase small subunit